MSEKDKPLYGKYKGGVLETSDTFDSDVRQEQDLMGQGVNKLADFEHIQDYIHDPSSTQAAERVPSAARPSQELAQSDANGMATLEALVKDSEEALMEVEECNDGPDVFEDTVADEEAAAFMGHNCGSLK